MILKRISILNYKNLEEVEIGFFRQTELFFRPETAWGKRTCWMRCISCLFLQKLRKPD